MTARFEFFYVYKDMFTNMYVVFDLQLLKFNFKEGCFPCQSNHRVLFSSKWVLKTCDDEECFHI